MKDDTLYTEISNNIGAVRIEQADAEIERIIKQTGNPNWHKDFHEFMYCWDETDPDVYNPCPLSEGYCWVTCD